MPFSSRRPRASTLSVSMAMQASFVIDVNVAAVSGSKLKNPVYVPYREVGQPRKVFWVLGMSARQVAKAFGLEIFVNPYVETTLVPFMQKLRDSRVDAMIRAHKASRDPMASDTGDVRPILRGRESAFLSAGIPDTFSITLPGFEADSGWVEPVVTDTVACRRRGLAMELELRADVLAWVAAAIPHDWGENVVAKWKRSASDALPELTQANVKWCKRADGAPRITASFWKSNGKRGVISRGVAIANTDDDAARTAIVRDAEQYVQEKYDRLNCSVSVEDGSDDGADETSPQNDIDEEKSMQPAGEQGEKPCL